MMCKKFNFNGDGDGDFVAKRFWAFWLLSICYKMFDMFLLFIYIKLLPAKVHHISVGLQK